MSDCANGGRRAYNAPTHSPAEDRLEITVHFHGEFNPHPIVLNRLDREVDYVTVDGQRFERVRECHVMSDYSYYDHIIPEWNYDYCSNCGGEFYDEVPNYCPYCGAKVKVGA